MIEPNPETGWDLLPPPSQPEAVVESTQQLAELLKKTTYGVRSQKADGVYRPVEYATYGEDLTCMRQILPYLPVYQQSSPAGERLVVAKINTYWFGGGLLDPFAYEIYGTDTTMAIEDFWKLKVRNPRGNLDELFTDHKIATVALTPASNHSSDDRMAEYLAVNAAARPLDIDAIDAIYGLVDLYNQRAAIGLDVSRRKLKKSLYKMPAVDDIEQQPPKSA